MREMIVSLLACRFKLFVLAIEEGMVASASEVGWKRRTNVGTGFWCRSERQDATKVALFTCSMSPRASDILNKDKSQRRQGRSLSTRSLPSLILRAIEA